MIPLVSPCGIAHHAPGSRVGFHKWHNDARCMEYFFGRVIAHVGRQVRIEVDSPRREIVTTECGHTFPAEAVKR